MVGEIGYEVKPVFRLVTTDLDGHYRGFKRGKFQDDGGDAPHIFQTDHTKIF